ncbi:dTDP-4-dehydrorhamnose 3,5-epimerase family protein [Arsukibacterium sp.]|uniref:dTDP-4-dehydrorhamnose 3,5-epimerase family protein n=1 Tax=Arsukibacterium sp. TaxID=1977258 RepID=UPI002FDB0AB1
MLYLHTAQYHPQHEGGCRVDDPAFKINWPLPITLLSERDASLPLLDHSFNGITL